MALESKKAKRELTRSFSGLERDYRALRAKAGKLRREELAVWRRLEKLVRGKPGRLMTVSHRRGQKDKITRPRSTGSGSFLALARARGSSGLFCGCRPIVIAPQPNDDIDVCILIACSNDPATSGFRCEYWCTTFEAPPVVAVARGTRRLQKRKT
ncbi:MAG: hypothetical protein ACREDZ_16225 [Kiloniellales bacterium]